MSTKPVYFTIEDVAERLKVSTNHVARLCRQHNLNDIYRPNYHCRMFTEVDIRRLRKIIKTRRPGRPKAATA